MAEVGLPSMVPFVQPPMSTERNNATITIDDLDPKIRRAFPKLTSFNNVQRAVANAILHTDDSIVVNAPTGSGKTVILELAMLKLSSQTPENFRIIYLAPTRSLCAEKYQDWSVRFTQLGINCIQFDGDNAVEDVGKLANYRLIVSTPEKWEVFTRHWDDQSVAAVLRPIKLFLVDEIQIMNDSDRGANLELVLSRMKYIDARFHRERLNGLMEQPESIRFIAVSACVPNVTDFAQWLKNERNVVPFSFDESNRVTRIERHVLGYPCNSSPFVFELNLNYKLPPIIEQYAGQKPTLVFCTTRKSVESTARFLARSNMRRSIPAGSTLQELAGNLANKNLQDCVTKGIAYHHAGLLLHDRTQIESHFRAGHIAVLCSTSTLCMGVNLPAYLVVVKSTFNHAGKDYADNYILQMIGRAGRAEFSEDGVAVIMTTEGNLARYRSIVTGTAPIESQLHRKFPELLNSEIAHGLIYDPPAVMEWIRSTYFYVRAHMNPAHYQLPGGRHVEEEIEKLCTDTIESLEASGLITRRRPNSMMPTVCGRLMARNQISFRTMQLLQTELKGTESLSVMLALLTRANEFSEYKCRVGEKKILNALNAPKVATSIGEGDEECTGGGIRFRCPGRISTTGTKVYCLVQAVFGNLAIHDHGLHQEAAKIITLGARISRFVVGLLAANRDHFDGGCWRAMVSVTTLLQCFQTKLWEDSPFLMKQLGQIGPKLARHLANRGKVTFQSILNSDPREIECILNKHPPLGNDIIGFVSGLPQFTIELTRNEENPPVFQCTICQRNMDYDPEVSVGFSVLVGDSANRILLHQDNCTMESIPVMGCTWPLVVKDTSVESLTARLICLDWTGLDCSHTLHLVDQPATNMKHRQTTITHFFPNQTASESILPTEMPTMASVMKLLKKNESMTDESFANATMFNHTSEADSTVPERNYSNILPSASKRKYDHISLDTRNPLENHSFEQLFSLRSMLNPTVTVPSAHGWNIGIPPVVPTLRTTPNESNIIPVDRLRSTTSTSSWTSRFRSEEFMSLFQPERCTLNFTLCSPADDIVSSFEKYNIFVPNRETILPRPEANERSTVCEAKRMKKNFDLGPAANVICSDDDAYVD